MKTKTILFLLSFIFLIAISSSKIFALQLASTTDLSGHVYAASEMHMMHHSNDKVISNADVSLHKFTLTGDSTFYSTKTDSNGEFKFSGINNGEYILHCDASGYTTLIIRNFDVFRNSDNINLFLHDSTSISGGFVKGEVDLDISGMAITHAIIEFISADSTNTNYFTTTNMHGEFYTKIPAGKYYVMASISTHDSSFFYQEYYKNAQSIADAKTITVTQGEITSDIDFNVPQHIYTQTHSVTITGNVKSSLSVPLADATIKVISTCNFEEHGRDLAAKTQTDALGNFSITLDSLSQSQNAFVVSAWKDGYQMQFYNNENAFFNAERLISFSDTTFANVDFQLTAIDTQNTFKLSGNISDSSGIGIRNAFIMARDSSNGHVRIAISDSAGNYSFNSLFEGTYYLVFYAKGYDALFYPNSDEWENATAIHLNGSMSNVNVELTKQDSMMHRGSGQFVGRIHSRSGAALPGVLVTVKNSANITVGQSITDATGTYTISGMMQGSYTITASLSQYSSQQQSTSYDPNSGTTQINNFTMPESTTSVETSVKNGPSNYVLNNNYPNPFNPSTVISFSIPEASHVKLSVYNILGQKVAQLMNKNLTAGNYKVDFNAAHLSSGVYLYRLETNNFTSTKKMILTK